VPDELVRDVNLIGTREFVVAPMAATPAERVKLIETLRNLVD
jgi:hypothetical protein